MDQNVIQFCYDKIKDYNILTYMLEPRFIVK